MRWTRILSLIPVTCVGLLFVSCSYSTDFVVVNKSNQPIEVLYKVSNKRGPLASLEKPNTTDVSELNDKGGQNWTPLASSQYVYDEASHTVTVRLEARKALRVVTMFHYFGHHDAQDAANYPIEYINLTGASGSVTLAGDQARMGFIEVSRALYTLTYQ